MLRKETAGKRLDWEELIIDFETQWILKRNYLPRRIMLPRSQGAQIPLFCPASQFSLDFYH